MIKCRNKNILIDFSYLDEVLSLLKGNGYYIDGRYYNSYHITCYDGESFYRIELRPKLSIFGLYLTGYYPQEIFKGEEFKC